MKECGAEVDQTMNDGSTPVYVAAQNGHEAVVRCLAKECGADANQCAAPTVPHPCSSLPKTVTRLSFAVW